MAPSSQQIELFRSGDVDLDTEYQHTGDQKRTYRASLGAAKQQASAVGNAVASCCEDEAVTIRLDCVQKTKGEHCPGNKVIRFKVVNRLIGCLAWVITM